MGKKRSKAQIEADMLRTGRPLKPLAEKQTERVTVYLTKAERERLGELARREGVPLATLIMRSWREKGE